MSIQKKDLNSKSPTGEIRLDTLENKERIHEIILLILILIFIGFSAFALGRLSVNRGSNERSVVVETVAPLLIKDTKSKNEEAKKNTSAPEKRTQTKSSFLVGSRNSTKYHFPWCSGAKRIKPENLITFDSYETARSAGYTPAGNCDGLQ